MSWFHALEDTEVFSVCPLLPRRRNDFSLTNEISMVFVVPSYIVINNNDKYVQSNTIL